jgi:hypothetical protein
MELPGDYAANQGNSVAGLSNDQDRYNPQPDAAFDFSKAAGPGFSASFQSASNCQCVPGGLLANVASVQLDYSGTELPSLYDSIANAESHLDASENLQNGGIPPDHEEFVNLPANDIPLATPNYLDHLNPSTQDQPIAKTPKKTPKTRRPSQSLHSETSSADLEELERVRKKNRTAGGKFRQRQKDLESSLHAKILELSDEQSGLVGERNNLQSEVFSLTSQLSSLQCMEQPATTALLSPVSPGSLSPNFDVSYGELLTGNLEESVIPQPDMTLSDFPISPDFSMDDSISEEYGLSFVSDPMDHVIPPNQK